MTGKENRVNLHCETTSMFTCYSGVPFRGYASVKNATEPSSTCKHYATIGNDVGLARVCFDSIIGYK